MRKLFQLLVLLMFLCQGCSAQKSSLIEDTKTVDQSKELSYYLFLPKDYTAETASDFGLLLFLHGGGESGGELADVTKHGPPKMMADGYPFPFLVLAPQNPYKKKFWDIWSVKVLLDQIVEEYGVDPKRIYLTGLSRGGSAAWELAVQFPDRFAALAVVCGRTPVPYAHWLDEELAIKMFHGVDDPIIPVSESDQMYQALLKREMQVEYQRYENTGHNSWDKAYSSPGLFDWFNAQQKSQ